MGEAETFYDSIKMQKQIWRATSGLRLIFKDGLFRANHFQTSALRLELKSFWPRQCE